MDSKPRILVVSDYRNTHSVRPEAEIFMRLLAKGYTVHVMSFEGCEYLERFAKAGATVIPYHPETKNDAKARKLIRYHVQEHNIDVVHFYNSRASVNGLHALRGIDVKICLYRGFTGHVHWYDPSLYAKYMHPRVDRIVCNSRGVEEEFLKQPFIDKNRTRTIHKGHDVHWYADVKPLNRSEFGLSEDSLLLVNVANNRKMKGIRYLLGAINELPPESDIRLLLVGKDMDNAEHLSILDQGPNRDKVIFTGYRTDALSIVKMCDSFVLTSIKGESITKAVIESMSLGRAPIISNIPGNTELAIHEESGLVVPMKDPSATAEAILRYFNDRDLLKKMQEGAYLHIKNYLTIDRTIEQYEEMYQELFSA